MIKSIKKKFAIQFTQTKLNGKLNAVDFFLILLSVCFPEVTPVTGYCKIPNIEAPWRDSCAPKTFLLVEDILLIQYLSVQNPEQNKTKRSELSTHV